MHIGVMHFHTDTGPEPARFARRAEDLGFESIFVPEHTHIPVSASSPYPVAYGGGSIPDHYKRTLDQFVTMSFMAAATSSIKVASGVTLVAQHDPIDLAKQVASLDHLSHGRFLFGVGFGWNRGEAEDHGIEWKDRVPLVREKIEMMRRLWTCDEAEYEGDFVNLQRSWAWPKPAQVDGPPILLGGASRVALQEAALWADSLYVIPPADDPLLARTTGRLHSMCQEMGRDPSSIGITVAGSSGHPDVLEAYAEAGMERVVIAIRQGHGSESLAHLESAAARVERFLAA